MRKATKQELYESNQQHQQQTWILEEALAAVMLGESEKIGETTLEDNGCEPEVITGFLIHPTRAHGGIILIQSRVGYQRPMFRVNYLEHEYTGVKDGFTLYNQKIQAICSAAFRMRQRALDAEVTA